MRSNPEVGTTFTHRARRAQLIDSAVSVLAESGYQAASLSAIASRAGVSKGVVSYHFAGKDDLLGQVVGEIYAAAGAAIATRVAQAGDAAARLLAYVEANLGYVGQNPHQIRALMEIVSNARDGNGRLRFSPSGADPLVEHVAQLLLSGQDAGHFRPFDTQAMAVIVRGLIDTASARLVSDPAFDLTAYTAEVIRTLDTATSPLQEDRS